VKNLQNLENRIAGIVKNREADIEKFSIKCPDDFRRIAWEKGYLAAYKEFWGILDEHGLWELINATKKAR
jgi:hypothetical protein